MAKFELKFIDLFGFHFIRVFKTEVELYTKNKDVIRIELEDYNSKKPIWITLDKSTAIKFAKTLRTEINKIESEVNNGNL